MDSKGSLHGFLGTLLSPDMSVDEKREVLVRDYGMGMEQELGEGLGQMCNLSEAIEERGFSKGFSEGMEGFALLVENLLKESGLGDLQRAVKDEALCRQLFEEYDIVTKVKAGRLSPTKEIYVKENNESRGLQTYRNRCA